MCSNFHCPSSTVTELSEGSIQQPPPFIDSQKSKAEIVKFIFIQMLPLRFVKYLDLKTRKDISQHFRRGPFIICNQHVEAKP